MALMYLSSSSRVVSSWTISVTDRSMWWGCMRYVSFSFVCQILLIVWASRRRAPLVLWNFGRVDSLSYRTSISSGWNGYVSAMRCLYSARRNRSGALMFS